MPDKNEEWKFDVAAYDRYQRMFFMLSSVGSPTASKFSVLANKIASKYPYVGLKKIGE